MSDSVIGPVNRSPRRKPKSNRIKVSPETFGHFRRQKPSDMSDDAFLRLMLQRQEGMSDYMFDDDDNDGGGEW